MSQMSPALTGAPSLSTMAGIEARRFARNPVFLVSTALTLGVTLYMALAENDPHLGDLLSWPVVPAFFMGLPSILVAARLTRSTDAATEALDSAPGSEARRTLALALASVVPFTVGLVWLVEFLVLVSIDGAAPQEWWFATMPDQYVWAALIAGGPVACAGGALLGVLTGRWLKFPGAAVIVLVVTMVVCVLSMGPAQSGHSEFRLWTPWAVMQSGTDTDGTASIYAGNMFFYLLYVLCLCVAAALVAMWHDRTARTARLKGLILGTVVVGLVSLGLAVTTGYERAQVSDPVPYKIDS
jgi:hypothetical protein